MKQRRACQPARPTNASECRGTVGAGPCSQSESGFCNACVRGNVVLGDQGEREMAEAFRGPAVAADCLMSQIADLSGAAASCNLRSATGQSVDPKNPVCVKCLRRRRVFREWLSLPLLNKRTDLQAYLDCPFPKVASYPLQLSTAILRIVETPLICRGDVYNCIAVRSPSFAAAIRRQALVVREGVGPFLCNGPFGNVSSAAEAKGR
jgi:hypothetical protein